MEREFDAIIVGAGAGGGVAAAILAEAGKRVLLLDRGSRFNVRDVGRDHLRNHRFSRYGINLGPLGAGHPRVLIDPTGKRHLVQPPDAGYHNNAMAVGGGTVVYGAQAWRFAPNDFRMASIYGVPDGSSLADWPISYDELEKDYGRAEWEIGVGGDGAPRAPLGPRRRGYPMPPVADNAQRRILSDAAGKLGWDAGPVPLAINTTHYNGRPPCDRCGPCVGFSCLSDSKNGTHNTMIPRALATGNCTIVPDAIAERIDTDQRGKVVGVTYFDTGSGEPQRISARARAVIVACGAIESARLLLNSKSAAYPQGLGNQFDQVGRHLQGHYYVGAIGRFDEQTYDAIGPGVSIATCQFNHGNPGIVGGGMLANEFIKTPIQFWYWAWPPGLPRWGLAAKRFMRDGYSRTIHVQGPVQEIPSPHARVTLDPDVRDCLGIPVARLSGTTHPETVRTALFLREKAKLWLHAAGAREIHSGDVGLVLSGGQHQAGTCRMGEDPRTSVTDKWGRVHGHANLLVMDGSLHVTNGGFNPVLTIMALAFRCASELAANL
jgi:choline dehydrogenase-like flavoprotein